jgi:hypothetical protein
MPVACRIVLQQPADEPRVALYSPCLHEAAAVLRRNLYLDLCFIIGVKRWATTRKNHPGVNKQCSEAEVGNVRSWQANWSPEDVA